MTTQIEKEFFSCFDIEEEKRYCEGANNHYVGCPPITPAIVLELIKLLIDNGQTLKIFEASEMFKDHTRYIVNAETELRHDIYGTGANLNEAVLKLCMRFGHIKQSVQKLFKEGKQ